MHTPGAQVDAVDVNDRALALCRDNALRTLDATASVHKLNIAPGDGSLVAQYRDLLAALNTAMLDTHTKRDFSDVFTKFIHS